MQCANKNCHRRVFEDNLFCEMCSVSVPPLKDSQKSELDKIAELSKGIVTSSGVGRRVEDTPMSLRYPKYYKPIPKGLTELDIYAICKIFPVVDSTGCINHARKKLLVPGSRTGGKSFYADIKEARDTLTRWLELNPETPTEK